MSARERDPPVRVPQVTIKRRDVGGERPSYMTVYYRKAYYKGLPLYFRNGNAPPVDGAILASDSGMDSAGDQGLILPMVREAVVTKGSLTSCQ
jgi:hypothetical protein